MILNSLRIQDEKGNIYSFTDKKDNTIWVRECKFCGKVEKIILI